MRWLGFDSHHKLNNLAANPHRRLKLRKSSSTANERANPSKSATYTTDAKATRKSLIP